MFRYVSAVFLFACCASVAGEIGMQDLIARVEALEARNRELEQKLTAAELRPKVTAQVDKAIAESQAKLEQVVTQPDPHCRPLKVGGYLDFSYEYNLNRPDNMTNNLRPFDRDSNGFNLHLAEIYFSRLPEEPGQAGFRMDFLFGSDARFTAAQDNFGLPASRVSDFEVVDFLQAYASYIAPVGNGITLDAGKFATWCGSEVVQASDNINSSRSYLFFFAEPATHTGIRATYPVFKDKWTVGLAALNGWDNLQDQNNAKTLMAMSNWTPLSWFNWLAVAHFGDEQTVDERARLAAAVAAGADPTDPATPGFGAATAGKYWDSSDGGQPRFLIDSVMTFTPWKNWTFQLAGDWATEGKRPRANGPRNAQWWGVAGYVKWQFLKNWYIANRTEYFNDEEGVRTGRRQTLWETTFTADWAISDPLHLRFEYRHDDSNVDAFSDKRGVDDNFAGGNPFHSDRQDTIMMQWLLKF